MFIDRMQNSFGSPFVGLDECDAGLEDGAIYGVSVRWGDGDDKVKRTTATYRHYDRTFVFDGDIEIGDAETVKIKFDMWDTPVEIQVILEAA